eukprot:gnl/MRDRNA2_/MRDRNA2_90274_c0_seq1.p1 gnl/MRDRNA2_/MRDRNA2_90274_c0~~gnl/MRDRNA2_/MRDRNA2_90274_c0_seq1.p1  ORF type:complete len:237 (+),score=23.07 gnl/MRDRNA2_/MRDRNA2_90274_c0_seq1:82-792(+)
MGQGDSAFQQCHPLCSGPGMERSNSCESELPAENAVLLNVYDLNEDWLVANQIFQQTGELGGAFHCGVEIYGNEWTFGKDGVFASRPRWHPIHMYRQTIVVGHTGYSPEDVLAIIEDERCGKWQGRSYDLLSRNCCTFSRAICKRLTGEDIPDWVDRLPRLLHVVKAPVTAMANGLKSVPLSNMFQRSDVSIDSLDSDFSLESFVFDATPTRTKYADPKDSYIRIASSLRIASIDW